MHFLAFDMPVWHRWRSVASYEMRMAGYKKGMFSLQLALILFLVMSIITHKINRAGKLGKPKN